MNCPSCDDKPEMEVVARSEAAATQLTGEFTAIHAIMYACPQCGYHEWRSN